MILCYNVNMSREIIPSNTKAGRALKAITRLQIVTVSLAVGVILIDILPVVFHRESGAPPILSMIVIPIGFQIIALTVLVEIIIIISALVKKRK